MLFDDKEVARLAAEAMDNYLLFDRRLRCKVLHKTVPGVIRSGPRLLPHVAIEASRLKQARRQCARKSEEEIKQARVSALIHAHTCGRCLCLARQKPH